MPKQFVWTGLPRTRTNWASRYFSGIDGVECHHELLCGLRSKQEFYDAMEDPEHEFVGNSDSGIFLTNFQEHWPDIKTVIIERDIEDVFKSLCAFFEEQGYAEPSMSFLLQQKEALDGMKGLRVPYGQIDESMPAIHAYLNIPYDKDYHASMLVQNLQIPVLIPDVESYELWTKF